MKLSFKLEGKNSITKMLKAFGLEGEKEIEMLTKIRANSISTEAKQIATAKGVFDNGTLVQGIQPEPIDKFNWSVIAHEPYSAFHEFGTGNLVEIPLGYEKLAIQFKGAGIKEVNIPARPFMYPAFKNGAILYRKDLFDSFDYLTKKHSSK